MLVPVEEEGELGVSSLEYLLIQPVISVIPVTVLRIPRQSYTPLQDFKERRTTTCVTSYFGD